jgi:ribosomal protein S4
MARLISSTKAFRKFNEDLWGTVRLNNRANGLGNTFLEEKGRRPWQPFTFDITSSKPVKRRRRLSQFGHFLVERQKICMFYGGLTRKEYKRICIKASTKKVNVFNNFKLNLNYLLESSLAFSLYRSGFMPSIGTGLQFVKEGNLMVNKEIIRTPFFTVKPGDVVEVVPYMKEAVFLSTLDRIENDKFLYIGVPYLHINYSNMSFSFIAESFSEGSPFYPFKFRTSFFTSDFKGKF